MSKQGLKCDQRRNAGGMRSRLPQPGRPAPLSATASCTPASTRRLLPRALLWLPLSLAFMAGAASALTVDPNFADGPYSFNVDSLAVDGNKNLYWSSPDMDVQYLPATGGAVTGGVLTAFPSCPQNDGSMRIPGYVAVDSDGNVYTVYENAFNGNDNVIRCSPGGTSVILGDGYYSGLAIDHNDNLYTTVYDSWAGTSHLHKYSLRSGTSTVIPGVDAYPTGMAVDSSNNLYLAYSTGTVTRVAADGTVTHSFITGLAYTAGIAVDADNNLYVANGAFVGNGELYRFNAIGGAVTGGDVSSAVKMAELNSEAYSYVIPNGLLAEGGYLYTGNFNNPGIVRITLPASVSTATLSDDTGASGSDWVTTTAAQTISGTVSAALEAGDKVQVSYDDGATWSDATTQPSGAGTSWSTTTTLAGSDTFQARVYGALGSTKVWTHSYAFDDAAPSAASGSLNVEEHAANGTAVGAVSATDANAVTYTLTDDAGGAFAVSAGGAVTVANGDLLGYASASTRDITVRATDLAGNTSDTTLAVHIYPAVTMTDNQGNALGSSNRVKKSLIFTPGGGSGDFTVSAGVNANGAAGSLTVNGDGSYTFARPTIGAFAGDYVITVTDSVTGEVHTYTVTVPLAVAVSRPDLLGLGGSATVTVKGAAAAEDIALAVKDESGNSAGGVLAKADASITAADDAAHGNPANGTVTAENPTSDTPMYIAATTTSASGNSNLVTVVAADTYSGTVLDADGNAVNGATVEAEPLRDALNAAYTTVTDAGGHFVLNAPKASTAFSAAGAGSSPGAVAAAGCAGSGYACTVSLGAAGAATIIGASGSVTVGSGGTRVALSLAQTPVVIAGVPSYHGYEPGVVRVNNVSGTGFNVRFAEWEYEDGTHLPETIAWAALKPGRYLLADGSEWEVGSFTVSGTARFEAVHFSQVFAGTPRLFLTVQSEKGTDVVTARAKSVDNAGFRAALFEEEARMDGHAIEQVGYLAIYNPMAVGQVNLGGSLLDYDLAGARGSVSFQDVLSGYYQARVQEEQSKDAETSHVPEAIDLLLLGSGVYGADVSSRGPDTIGLRYR